MPAGCGLYKETGAGFEPARPKSAVFEAAAFASYAIRPSGCALRGAGSHAPPGAPACATPCYAGGHSLPSDAVKMALETRQNQWAREDSNLHGLWPRRSECRAFTIYATRPKAPPARIELATFAVSERRSTQPELKRHIRTDPHNQRSEQELNLRLS